MGVLACSRNGCDYILCENYSDEYGYLCDDCLEELISSGVRTDIETFLNSKKPDQYVAGQYYRAIFRRRGD